MTGKRGPIPKRCPVCTKLRYKRQLRKYYRDVVKKGKAVKDES